MTAAHFFITKEWERGNSMKKVFRILADIIRCLFLGALGCLMAGKGIAYLCELVMQGREVWHEPLYYSGIGFVKDDFSFYIGLIFICVGFFGISKAYKIMDSYLK